MYQHVYWVPNSSRGRQQTGLKATDTLRAPPVPTSLKLITSSVMPPERKVTSKIPEEKHGKTEDDRVFKMNSVHCETGVGGREIQSECQVGKCPTLWNRTLGPIPHLASSPTGHSVMRKSPGDRRVKEEREGGTASITPACRPTSPQSEVKKAGTGAGADADRWGQRGERWQVQLCDLHTKPRTWHMIRPL